MKAYLLQDIISTGKEKAKYGIKGDKVILIADHGNVQIVEHEKYKNRFSVLNTEIKIL